jgi:hypothetical protein
MVGRTVARFMGRGTATPKVTDAGNPGQNRPWRTTGLWRGVRHRSEATGKPIRMLLSASARPPTQPPTRPKRNRSSRARGLFSSAYDQKAYPASFSFWGEIDASFAAAVPYFGKAL